MEETEIRTATPADADVLTSLGRQTFYEAFKDQNSEADMQQYLAETFTEAKIREEFEAIGAQFFIAFVQGKPVGYAKISRRNTPKELTGKRILELERLYILKANQNQNIGAALMETCLKTARETDVETIWLGVWEHNVNAQKFYRRFGFEVFSHHIFMLGTDAQTDLLMKLEL